MNSPVNELIQFFRSLQDAKLSLSRLHEVHDYAEEEKEYHVPLLSEKYTRQNGIERGIYFKNVSFQYEGPRSPYVLKISICLFLKENNSNSGASGSGKTTLIKMFLKF